MLLYIDDVDSGRRQNAGFWILGLLRDRGQTKIWTFEQFLHKNNAKLGRMLMFEILFDSSHPAQSDHVKNIIQLFILTFMF